MVLEVLKLAISNKLVVNLEYNGARTVEPYSIYLNSKGKVFMECYQLSGRNNIGILEGWKVFDLDNISVITLTNLRFTLRSRCRFNHSNICERILYKIEE